MKRYGNLFEKIIDIENIKLAHKNASKGKKKYKEVKMVDSDVDYYCNQIREMLKSKTYKNSKYIEVEIHNVNMDKKRLIHKLSYFPDRIIHHAILQVLDTIWVKTFINDTYQSIKGRGIHRCKRKIEKITNNYKFNYKYKNQIKIW